METKYLAEKEDERLEEEDVKGILSDHAAIRGYSAPAKSADPKTAAGGVFVPGEWMPGMPMPEVSSYVERPCGPLVLKPCVRCRTQVAKVAKADGVSQHDGDLHHAYVRMVVWFDDAVPLPLFRLHANCQTNDEADTEGVGEWSPVGDAADDGVARASPAGAAEPDAADDMEAKAAAIKLFYEEREKASKGL